MLIALFLAEQQVLREPLLYLSLYLKTHRADYYRLLQEVRQRGTWEAWLEFFLTGVAATANNAHESALRIVTLFFGRPGAHHRCGGTSQLHVAGACTAAESAVCECHPSGRQNGPEHADRQ
ncbi:MAG: hypothetical protein ACRYGK_04785 [Janthinobacterium lividum]